MSLAQLKEFTSEKLGERLYLLLALAQWRLPRDHIREMEELIALCKHKKESK